MRADRQAPSKQLDQRGEGPRSSQRIQAAGALGVGEKRDTLFQFCLSLQVFCCKTIQDKSHITQKHRSVPLWFVGMYIQTLEKVSNMKQKNVLVFIIQTIQIKSKIQLNLKKDVLIACFHLFYTEL